MKLKLVLETGEEFFGEGFGAETIGKVVFNTSMVGYEQIIYDKANYNDIVVMTYPLIGNYGINYDDMESDEIQIKGLIAKEFNPNPSNFRSCESITDLFEESKLTYLSDFDTRALSRIIRDKGEMLGIITNAEASKEECLKKLKEYKPTECNLLIDKYEIKNKASNFRIACIDLGAKKSVFDTLSNTFDVTVFPYNVKANVLTKYDGIFIAGGPKIECVDLVKSLIGKLPIFATGVGCNVVAEAYGAKNELMKFGHRGGNHTAKYVETGKNYVISQNHNYVVSSVENTDLKVMCYNVIDKTIEGIECEKDKVFAIQYNLDFEASPEDANLLVYKFIKNIEKDGE